MFTETTELPVHHQPNDLLDVDDVAAYLKLSKRTVSDLPIPWSKVGGRKRRVLFRLLVDWVEAQSR